MMQVSLSPNMKWLSNVQRSFMQYTVHIRYIRTTGVGVCYNSMASWRTTKESHAWYGIHESGMEMPHVGMSYVLKIVKFLARLLHCAQTMTHEWLIVLGAGKRASLLLWRNSIHKDESDV